MNTPSGSPGFFEKFNSWISGSITIRIMSITILVLLLMIPNAMIRDIIFERQTTNEQVYQDIRQIWGQAPDGMRPCGVGAMQSRYPR
jgi:hypothetical protein